MTTDPRTNRIAASHEFFLTKLYPLQDEVLQHPADVARRLCQITRRDWQDVMWKSPPDPDEYLAEVIRLGESLILI